MTTSNPSLLQGFKQLQEDSQRIARKSGFYDDEDPTNVRDIASRLLLIVSEITEGLEEVRANKPARYYENNKPEGLAVELADAIIRIADFAEWQGFDLGEIILDKQAYNETRPYKHGGKAI
jgi:NTP pyrophosphatase (non-canonical NTP hydrolase)